MTMNATETPRGRDDGCCGGACGEGGAGDGYAEIAYTFRDVADQVRAFADQLRSPFCLGDRLMEPTATDLAFAIGGVCSELDDFAEFLEQAEGEGVGEGEEAEDGETADQEPAPTFPGPNPDRAFAEIDAAILAFADAHNLGRRSQGEGDGRGQVNGHAHDHAPHYPRVRRDTAEGPAPDAAGPGEDKTALIHLKGNFVPDGGTREVLQTLAARLAPGQTITVARPR